jgi:hypothetical protein
MSAMEYNDAYETCERTVVELRIYSDTVVPAEISRRLALAPSSSVTKGEVLHSRAGRQRVGQINSWILSSEENVESKDSRRHLDWLLARIGPAKDALLELHRTGEVTMYVTCIWWSALGNGGPRFWPRQLQSLGDLQLELEMDCAFFGTEPND